MEIQNGEFHYGNCEIQGISTASDVSYLPYTKLLLLLSCNVRLVLCSNCFKQHI